VVAVFVSHAPEDAAVAAELARALDAAGFMTWPDDERTPSALERSSAVVILASEASLGDRRVTDEVVHAYESGKPCVPVLLGLTHVEMTARQPEWRVALGAATSVEVPPEGMAAVAPRVVAGVRALVAVPRPAPPTAPTGLNRKAVVVGLASAVALVASAVVLLGGGDGGDRPADVRPSTSTHVIPRSTDSFSPGPLADAATTALTTAAGRLRVTKVALQRQVCSSSTQECVTAPGGRRYVVVTMAEWDGRNVVVTDPFMLDMDRSYVEAGTERATFTRESQQSFTGTITVVYETLPASATGLRLAWPGSPTLTLHLAPG
jgi:hypothetical protein